MNSLIQRLRAYAWLCREIESCCCRISGDQASPVFDSGQAGECRITITFQRYPLCQRVAVYFFRL